MCWGGRIKNHPIVSYSEHDIPHACLIQDKFLVFDIPACHK